MGSRAFCGLISQDELARARNSSGDRLTERLEALGLKKRERAQFDPARHRAYLEAHVEQGPRLINAGADIGVVTAIVGRRRFRIRFEGQADHAGTTPMGMRRDAAGAMFSFAVSVPERLRASGSAELVWNVGVVSVKPGAANVVATEAELIVEFRDVSDATVARMEQALEQTPIKLDHALEWRLRLSAQAKGCLGNPRFSAFGCCSSRARRRTRQVRRRLCGGAADRSGRTDRHGCPPSRASRRGRRRRGRQKLANPERSWARCDDRRATRQRRCCLCRASTGAATTSRRIPPKRTSGGACAFTLGPRIRCSNRWVPTALALSDCKGDSGR